jgi:hypothetical protein
MTTDKALEALRRAASHLSDQTGIKWTVGYIGNCDHRHDDRSWSLFAEHPGRVGTSADRIGSVSTAELPELVKLVQGACNLARVLDNRSLIRK